MSFKNPIKVFRPSIKKISESIVKFFSPFFILIPILIFVIEIIKKWEITLEGIGLLFILYLFVAVLTFALIFIIYLLSLLFPVKVYKEGFRCYNYYGFYKNVRWDDIRYVSTLNASGFKYAEVKVKGLKTKITISLLLSNMQEFKKLIEKYDTSGELYYYLESEDIN